MSVTVPHVFPMGAEATTTPERRGLRRDAVRLLVTDRVTGANRDHVLRDLPALLRPGDLLVVNDSTTLAAALTARDDGGATFALHLSTRIADDLWIAEPRAHQVDAGERIAMDGGATATFLVPVDAAHPRLWYVRLTTPFAIDAYLHAYGRPIHYKYLRDDVPIADYQTIFARVPGSAEMPSASRPFSCEVVDALHRASVRLATITLHAGVSSPERHERPYREQFSVPVRTAAAVNEARQRGSRIIAVGTTAVRALESAAAGGDAIASSGWTDLIITPERGTRSVDGLITGFHEPQASHLDLLRAFIDDATLHESYAHAAEAGYLWHEFGDLHLLL